MPDFTNIFSISLKIFSLAGLSVYLIFALIVVKQVSVMASNVHDLYNSHLKLFSYLHLVFALLILILAIFLL